MNPIFDLVSLATASHEFPSLGESLLYLSGIIFFLLLNAFFVASEFAIVKVRASQVEAVAKEHPVRAAEALKVLSNLDGYLSANQLGITIASLALGFLGEPFVAKLVSPLLILMGMKEQVSVLSFTFNPIMWISYVLAIASFTVLHVVVGELMPKSIAIRRALGTTLALAAPLHGFFGVFRWAILLLNGTANFLLKKLFNIDPVSESEHVHSADELALLFSQSERAKEVTQTEREILVNALELNELWVRDVMTQRPAVVSLNLEEPFEKALEIAQTTKHTRFPLVHGHLDHAVGLIHIKDLLKLINDPEPDLMSIKRDLKVVPDTMPLDTLLKFFLRERAHLAMVVDEFGTAVGIVFLDNVIEELVGDIQDEFDNERPIFNRINDDQFVIEGVMTLNVLADHVPELYIESGEVTTAGGFITQQLGRFPVTGESVQVLGYTAKIMSTDGRRVGQIHFEKNREGQDGEESEVVTAL